MHRKGTTHHRLRAWTQNARTPVLGLTTHTCLQAGHPHISHPPSGPPQPRPSQAKGSHTTILGRDTQALTPIQRPGTRANHGTLTPTTLGPLLLRKPAFTLPGPRPRRPRADPPLPGHLGPRFLAPLDQGGLRPGQAVGPQRGLSAIFPARAAHLPRSHQPALRPARRHCPSSPTARCAPAPGGYRPPSPPQPALHVLGLRRWSSALRPRVPRHQAQPPASDSAPARMLAPPGGAAREAAVRLRHRAAPREPYLCRRPRPRCRTSRPFRSYLYPLTSGGLGHLRCVLMWVWRDSISSSPAGVPELEIYLFLDSGKVAIV